MSRREAGVSDDVWGDEGRAWGGRTPSPAVVSGHRLLPGRSHFFLEEKMRLFPGVVFATQIQAGRWKLLFPAPTSGLPFTGDSSPPRSTPTASSGMGRVVRRESPQAGSGRAPPEEGLKLWGAVCNPVGPLPCHRFLSRGKVDLHVLNQSVRLT